MKPLFVFIISLIGIQLAFAQTDDDVELNQITLSVVLPDNSERMSQRIISKMESKIQHIVSRYGISGVGYSNEFVIYPKLEIYDESVVETGMKNIWVVEMEFNLFIQQLSNRKVYASYSKTIKGSGYTKDKAITNGISKINSNHDDLEEFINLGKSKILDYYNNNCSQIVSETDALVRMQQYDKALAILSSIPKEAAECYADVQDKTIEAYNAYQSHTCKKNVQKAKAQIAGDNYNGALCTLSYIDPNSDCASETESLIRVVAQKVEEKERKEWNLMLKKYEDRQNFMRYRMEVIKEISKAYYRSRPATVIYKSLF